MPTCRVFCYPPASWQSPGSVNEEVNNSCACPHAAMTSKFSVSHLWVRFCFHSDTGVIQVTVMKRLIRVRSEWKHPSRVLPPAGLSLRDFWNGQGWVLKWTRASLGGGRNICRGRWADGSVWSFHVLSVPWHGGARAEEAGQARFPLHSWPWPVWVLL